MPYDGNGPVLDLYRRDRAKGLTELISLTTEGVAVGGRFLGFSASAAADRIAFVWGANDAAAGDTNDVEDVYVRDVSTGSTRLVRCAGGPQGPGMVCQPLRRFRPMAGMSSLKAVPRISWTGTIPTGLRTFLSAICTLDTTERISVDSTGGLASAPPGSPRSVRTGRWFFSESESTNFARCWGGPPT